MVKKTQEVRPTNPMPLDNLPAIATKGQFVDTLKRNNKQIREDRAIAIVEDAQMKYKRAVEDLQMEMRKLLRDQDNMLDLSPTDSRSLIMASDFNAEDFVAKDIEISVKMRNLGIKLEVARTRFQTLFGE